MADPVNPAAVDAVILVGGQGTRLRPLTLSAPKPMLPTAGLPFLTHLLSRIADAGIEHVVLGTSFKAGVFETEFGDGSKLAIDINPATPAPGYTQLNVNGTVDVTGVDLVFTGAEAPASGYTVTPVNATSLIGNFTGVPSGGNCYNCHQISKEEISFGTIGPSLYHYGKLRGVSDPASPQSKAVVEYTWGKIWNAKAYNACSNMPRSGHMGNLTEQQVRDIMALLLDPASPVNK